MSTGNDQVKQSQVNKQGSMLHDSLRSTSDSIEQLLNKLEPILRASDISKDDSSKEPQEALVLLASHLREMHAMAANNNAIILDILDRIEL